MSGTASPLPLGGLEVCASCEGGLIECDVAKCRAMFCPDCTDGQRGGDYDGMAYPAICPACMAEGGQ